MDPDEFEAYLATLPPMERQQALYDFGFQKANFVPPGYDAAYGPELTQQQFDLGQYSQAPPSLDYEGNIEPYSLDIAGQLGNWQQDIGDLTADPVIAAMGGDASFDPQSFAPITTPIGEPLDLAGSRYVNAMAQAGGGYESYLAQKMLPVESGGAGLTPGGAIAAMWNDISAADAPEAPQDVKDMAADLKASLPPNTSTDPALQAPSAQQSAFDFSTTEGRSTSSNLDAITSTANDIFYKMTSDQPVGYTDPKTGLQYAGATEEPSELAAHFAELGIPTPFESYTDPKWQTNPLPEGYWEGRAQQADAAKGRMGEAKDVFGQTRENMQQLRQGWQDTAGDRAAAAARPSSVPVIAGTDIGAWQGPGMGAGQGGQGDQANPLSDIENWSLDEMGVQGGLPTPMAQAQAQAAGPDLTGTGQSYSGSGQQSGRGGYDQVVGMPQALTGTGNPYVMTGNGNDVLGTYDFGGMNEHDQGALGSILGLVAQGQGNTDVGFAPYDRSYIQDYGGAVQSAADQYGDASSAYQQYNYNTPEEADSLKAQGLALGMELAGRTPMGDALMQRAMSRRTVNPYYGY